MNRPQGFPKPLGSYLTPLTRLFAENADPENAVAMKKYMRDLFEFHGIKSPERRVLTRQFLQEQGLPEIEQIEAIVKQLWQLPEREYQYFGVGLLERMRKRLQPDHAALLEYLITTKSWWDTVDGLASHSVGGLFARYPETRQRYLARWRASDNFWLRRTTLLFQLGYKGNTDVQLLFDLIAENLGSSEFFINKAIGWALREYSKTDPAAVQQFVAGTPLEPLSEREALKWMRGKGMLDG